MRYKTMGTAALLSAALLLGLAPASHADTTKLVATSSISGKVVDADGKAVSGAVVRVMAGHAKGEKPAKNLVEDGAGKKGDKGEKGDKAGKKMKPVAEATTDEAGAFKVEVPAGEYAVRANLKGKGSGMAHVTVADGKAKTVEIKLEERGAKKDAK